MKTLNDLITTRRGRRRQDTDRTNLYEIIQVGEYREDLSPDALRQSAVDDIKRFRQKQFTYNSISDTRLILDSKISYIKEKFNITEEDLK